MIGSKVRRNIYDLSCYQAVCGWIGRLQTITNFFVYPNDTISIDLVGALRLSRLKRFLVLDCKVDLMAFFVPHRHINTEYTDMIKEGIQSSTTMPVVDVSAGSTLTVQPDYLGPVENGSIPEVFTGGYNAIWNEYIRPKQNLSERTSAQYETSDDGRKYGRYAARLPQFWNSGITDGNIDATDYAEVGGSSGSGVINLLDMARIQAEYKDQIDLDWFVSEYRDVLQHKFDSGYVSIDADQRPELLMHTEQWLSGYDVDGTDTAELGNWRGKSQGVVTLSVPPKHFNEGGMIWVMALLRFPSILQEEKHWYSTHTCDYDTFIGDPNVVATKPPHSLDRSDFVGGTDTVSWGTHPWGQWMRTSPSRVHANFHGPEGYPFVSQTQLDGILKVISEYEYLQDDFFLSEDLGQWNLISKCEVEARRVIPTTLDSVHAGFHLH